MISFSFCYSSIFIIAGNVLRVCKVADYKRVRVRLPQSFLEALTFDLPHHRYCHIHAVGSWCSVVCPCKPLSVLGLSVIVRLPFLSVSVGLCVAFFIFLQGWKFFKTSFSWVAFYFFLVLFSKVFRLSK